MSMPVAVLSDQRLLFVGGLHRSGTTPLARALSSHPQVSGFSDTGVPEDEGQHLQDVYPPARRLGGPGRFARNRAAHLTEESPLANAESASRLWKAWQPHWDLKSRVLVEKSPPNLLMTRFLNSMFPLASFLMIVRHPAVVTLSTAKWARRTPLPLIMDNWFVAHDTFRMDVIRLPRVKVITYEALTRRPVETLAEVSNFLGLEGRIAHEGLQSSRSSSYEARWRRMRETWSPIPRASYLYMQARYAERAETFGYSLTDLDYEGDAGWS